MTNHVLLNNVDHKDLRVITRRSAEFGDQVKGALTFCWEFRNVQAHYPIFFNKNTASGEIQAIAVFGFDDNENLFLDSAGWQASYIPLSIQRQPFLIGFQQTANGAPGNDPVIHIDLDSPRLSNSEGEPLFLPHGGISGYLDRINSILNTINEGLELDRAFSAMLIEHELLESFTLDIELNDGSQNRLMGFHTINEDALAQLDSDVMASLHAKGFLLPIYMAIASLSNIRALIDRKNAQLTR
jgi:hypothetical protein